MFDLLPRKNRKTIEENKKVVDFNISLGKAFLEQLDAGLNLSVDEVAARVRVENFVEKNK